MSDGRFFINIANDIFVKYILSYDIIYNYNAYVFFIYSLF
jgi:hypothetical protein